MPNKQWRVGYYESGRVPLFNNILKSFVKQLIMDEYFPELPASVFEIKDNKKLWNELSKINNAKIKFVKEVYCENNWVNGGLVIRQEKIDSVLRKYKIDIVMVMGTLAAQKLIKDNNSAVFIIMGASNIYKAGVTKGKIYSGYRNVFATINPHKYKQQMKIFHSIVEFKKLGIVYWDTPRNKTYSAIEDVEEMSKKLGFEIVSCFSNPEEMDEEKAINDLKGCYKHLAKRADAVYITVHRSLLKHSNVYELALPFLKAKVPTFVQEDPRLVEHGFLMAISPESDCQSEGRFAAQNLKKIIEGAVPGELDMRFHEKTSLYINKEVADIIEFEVPESILMVADKVYERIKYD